jgi:hypothetical protein
MTTEIITQWMGGLLALTTLGILFCGIWRGFQRQAGRTTGLILVSFGALLIYSTWTTLIYAFFAPLTSVRARREEAALAAEFGEQWQEYSKRVPAFFPRLRR